jgi:hypothetical protein
LAKKITCLVAKVAIYQLTVLILAKMANNQNNQEVSNIICNVPAGRRHLTFPRLDEKNELRDWSIRFMEAAGLIKTRGPSL